MDCPVDGATLLLSERQGIEIDYCPQCRGIWLDRGELDKLIERADAPGDRDRDRSWDRDRRDDDRDRGRGIWDEDRHRKPHKRKGLLGELFDFD